MNGPWLIRRPRRGRFSRRVLRVVPARSCSPSRRTTGGRRRVPAEGRAAFRDLVEMVVDVDELGLGVDRAGRDDQVRGGDGAPSAAKVEADARRKIEVLLAELEPVERTEGLAENALLALVGGEAEDLDVDD